MFCFFGTADIGFCKDVAATCGGGGGGISISCRMLYSTRQNLFMKFKLGSGKLLLFLFSHHKDPLFSLNSKQKKAPLLLVEKKSPLMKPTSKMWFSNVLSFVLTSIPS